MNYAINCILKIPWLSRSPHIRVVNELATTSSQHRKSYDPLCAVCSVALTEPQNEAIEQRFPHTQTSLEQGFPILNKAVEQGLSHTSTSDEQRLPINFEAFEQGLPRTSTSDEQRLPINSEVVEQGLPRTSTSDEQRFPIDIEVVGQGLLQTSEAVEDELPLLIDENGRTLDPHETDVGSPHRGHYIEVASPPCTAADITSLPDLTWKDFLNDLKAGDIEQVCIVSATEAASEEVLEARSKSDEPKSAREERFAALSWNSLRAPGNPVYNIALEYADIFPEKIPAELPADRGVRHKIDLVPGSKYCVTRQWPLPRDQVIAIDEFFEGRRKAGHVRESISPHSSPTFCVKKATGGWRIVHVFNKLNDATITTQTPIPRNDMVLNTMSASEIYSAIDLKDGFYQILMRDSDIRFTAISTPSGMLWEWLVMPQGLKNAPATFNRMVTQVLRPLRDFAPSYFDDIFVHSRAEQKLGATEAHRRHLKQVF
ncbi:unnamed protein product [Peronospora effusa]|nr:unnamed protein product [Peronospora effusa]